MCRQKSRRVERRHWRHLIGLDSLFQKTPMSTPKNEPPLSQEMHLKILHFSSGLKMSGTVEKLLFTYLWSRYHQLNPGIKLIHREAALHLFVKQIPPTESWHQVDSYRCNSHPDMPTLTLVSLLERYMVLETAMPRGDIRKRPSAHL